MQRRGFGVFSSNILILDLFFDLLHTPDVVIQLSYITTFPIMSFSVSFQGNIF